MPAVEIYSADAQMDELKEILDTNIVKTALDIPLTIVQLDGTDTLEPNPWGVMIQSPYHLIPGVFLPMLIIDMQNEEIADEQFNTAETGTVYYIYYVVEIDENDPNVMRDMYSKLKYLARFLIADYRDCQNSWFSMSLPSIEPNNEVNRFFAEQIPRVKIAAGRISFRLRDKRTYR